MKLVKVVIALLTMTELLSLQTSAAVADNSKSVEIAPNTPLMTAPYQTDSCDPDALGEKIKEKAKTLSDNVCTTADIANADTTGFFTKEKKDFYTKQCERSKEMVNDPKAASKFAETGKTKNDSSCYVVEIDTDEIGDNDGICTQSEKIKGGCQEAIDDAIGNDNGTCEELREISNTNGKKVKSWETCEEVCTISEEETANDCSQLQAMDGYLEDMNDVLVETNAQTAANLQVLAQQQIINDQVIAQNALPATDLQTMSSCENVLDVEITTPGITWYSGEERKDEFYVSMAANHVLELSTLGSNLCTDTFGTAVLGTSHPYICIFTHIVLSASSETLSNISLIDDEITATRIDNMSACMEQMGQSMEQMSQANATTQAKLDEVIRLLNTPQGRRDTFPTK